MFYLGQAIRIIRHKFNETQKVMADKLQITHIYLSYLETNKYLPSLRLIKRIEEIYGYNPYLLACLLEKGKDSTIERINQLHLVRIEDYSGSKTSNS